MTIKTKYPLTPFLKSAWMDWGSSSAAGQDLRPYLTSISDKLDLQLHSDETMNRSLEYIKKGVHNISKPTDDNGLYDLSPSLETSDSPYKTF